MRTSLRVFTAAVASLLVAGFMTFIPFAKPASAVAGVHTVSIDSQTVGENAGQIVAKVRLNVLNFVPTVNITGDIYVQNGTARGGGKDFDANNDTKVGEFDFAGSFANETTQDVPLALHIVDDAFREPSESFSLVLKNVQQASVGTPGTVTITDNEVGAVPTFKITPLNQNAAEGNDAAPANVRQVSVELLNPQNQPAHLSYATVDQSATSVDAKGLKDYVPTATTQELAWPANVGTAQQITVQINGDTIPEPNETFGINFGGQDNGQLNDPQAKITLNNDDGSNIPQLNIDVIPDKAEGDSGTTTQTVTVTLTNNAQQTVTVDYTTADGTAVASAGETKGDYEKTAGTLTFTQGTTSRSFDVPVNGDAGSEPDEGYTVSLLNPINATIGTGQRTAVIKNDDQGQITTGPSTFGGPHLRLFGATGSDLGGFFTYTVAPGSPPYNAGIHVARGDIFKADGSIGADGIDEIIVGPGKGITARVLIMSTDGAVKGSFYPFGTSFDGGVYVAAGEIDGDASNGDEIVVGAGPGGGPHVRVVKLQSGGADQVKFIGSFFPYDTNFKGGVRVAVGDVAGDGKAEIVTAPGPGGGPNVKVNRLNAQGLNDVLASWYAYGANFPGGVSVAAAKGHVVTGAGPGGNPHVRVWNGSGQEQGGWYAYNEGFTGGVNVGMGNLDNTTDPEIVTGAGPGGGPHVRIWNLQGQEPFGGGFFAYAPNYSGGVEVAVSQAG